MDLLLQPPFAYDDLRDLTTAEFNFLERLKSAGKAPGRGGITKKEKAECEKHVFQTVLVRNPDSSAAGAVHDFIYSDSQFKRIFDNVRREFTSTPRTEVLIGIQRSSYPDLLQKHAIQLEGVHKLTALLGLRNSTDTDTIVTQTILEDNMEAIKVIQTLRAILLPVAQCDILMSRFAYDRVSIFAAGCHQAVQRPQLQRQVEGTGGSKHIRGNDQQDKIGLFAMVIHEVWSRWPHYTSLGQSAEIRLPTNVSLFV